MNEIPEKLEGAMRTLREIRGLIGSNVEDVERMPDGLRRIIIKRIRSMIDFLASLETFMIGKVKLSYLREEARASSLEDGYDEHTREIDSHFSLSRGFPSFIPYEQFIREEIPDDHPMLQALKQLIGKRAEAGMTFECGSKKYCVLDIDDGFEIGEKIKNVDFITMFSVCETKYIDLEG